MPRLRCYPLALALVICHAALAHAQLRIVSYNTATAQATGGTQTARLPYSSTILEAIGLESYGPTSVSRPIDVLLLQEQFNMELTTQSFVDVLNDIYDPFNRTMYARSEVNGQISNTFFGSGGRPGMIYNTHTVILREEDQFGDVGSGTNQQPRASMRYKLGLVGYDSNADFYAYSSHYSASAASQRLAEAQAVRTSADALPEGTPIIYAGDFNITSSGVGMYQHLTTFSGYGLAFDPLNKPTVWSDRQYVNNNPALEDIRYLHTQSPAADGEGIPGYAAGGMDDRYDFQLVTSELLDNEGMSYLSGSYHAFGNNGTHALNGSITTGTGASTTVLEALKANSDHLPVVADYQLPAKMLASLASIPSNVAQGATVGFDVFVQNVADVLNSSWADELDYTISVSGSLLGSANGTSFPLAGANTHQLFLDTSTNGFRTGTITVAATSQGTANALYEFPVNFTVGDGGGGPVFGVIARDTFDEDEKLLSFSQTPPPGAFGDAGDGFQEYQLDVSPTVPFQLVDDTTNGTPSDNRGIVNGATKTDIWFGVTDTVNGSGQPTENPGVGTATWVFDVSGAIDMEVSIDMGAMGQFDVTPATNRDRFDWTYQFDNGPILPLFTSSVNELGAQDYTMADGDVINVTRPIDMLTTDSQTITLSNILQTLTSPLTGSGETLTIQFIAKTDGADEGYAFDNLIVEGLTFQEEFLEADFNEDGDVNGEDLAQWQEDYGVNADSDADDDGDTDGRDFLIWQQQFGQSPNDPLSAVTGTTIPEPSSLLLVKLAALFSLVSRRSMGR